MSTNLLNPSPLFHEIKTLIDSARQRATVAVNTELTLLYWRVGPRIYAEALDCFHPAEIIECGEILHALSAKLRLVDKMRGQRIESKS